jgi:hypothetical protein
MSRIQRLFILGPLTCAAVGVVVGTVVVLVVGSAMSSHPNEVSDLLEGAAVAATHFVVVLMWATIFAGPFGIIAGLFGASLVVLLGEGRLRGAPRSRWLRWGALVGGLVGGATPGVLLLLSSVGTAGIFAAAGAVAGVAAGATLADFGWHEFGSKGAPPAALQAP